MPIYEYRCAHCGHEMDALQKLSDKPLLDCPQCGRPALKKLISAVGFRLKGSGWYETDFKGDNKKNLYESSEKKPPESAEKSKEGKPAAADKKPAATQKATT